MTWTRLILMIVVAAGVTPPSVLLFPHARKSPTFDRLMWAATGVLAFLGDWLAPRYVTFWEDIRIGDTALAPIVLGALAGAFVLHPLLWLLDLLDRPVEEEDQSLSSGDHGVLSQQEEGHDVQDEP